MILPAVLVFAPAKFPVPHVAEMWVAAVAIAGGWWVAARLAARRTDAGSGARRHADRCDVRRVARNTGATGGRPHVGHANWPGRSTARAIPAGVVDGRATPGIAGFLPRSRVATRAHGRPRSPLVEPAGARARAGARHTGCRHGRGLATSGPGTCPSRASPSNRRGTTASTTGSACCTKAAASTRGPSRPTCRTIGWSTKHRPSMARPGVDALQLTNRVARSATIGIQRVGVRRQNRQVDKK